MALDREQFDVRWLGEDSPRRNLALHLAFGVSPPSRADAAGPVADLLDKARAKGWPVELVCGAYRSGKLVSACFALESAGSSALVFVSGNVHRGGQQDATVAVLEALQDAAWRRSLAVLQALVAPRDAELGRALRQAGFRRLTRLLYLERDIRRPMPRIAVPDDLEWVGFAPEHEELFRRTVDATYVQSLDCPKLAGLRETDDVLAGHRATGEHDPGLWWVAMAGGRPVGVLLLTRLSPQPMLEVVYMGVVCPARGQGIGNALLRRALDLCRQESAMVLTLAVDQANTPARRLYERWGLVQTVARDAWIANPPRNKA